MGGTTTLTNAGVISVIAGTGITVSGSTGAVTINSTATGTVTSVSVTGNSGVLAGVATATTTPAISIGLGNITPISDTSVFTGSIGATTPNTGAFTTLNSSGKTLLATSTGNVGIGTTAPQNTLQVSGSLSSYTNSSTIGSVASAYSEIVTTPINLAAGASVDVGTISVTTNTCWRAIVRGTFSNNYDGGALTPPAFYIELNSVQNTIPCGSTSITVSRNATTNKLQFTNNNGSYVVTFTGTIEIIVNTQSGQPANSIITVGNVGIGTSSPVSLLQVNGNSDLTWGSSASPYCYGTTTIGTGSTATSSLFVNTASINSGYWSGFGVNGTYSSGISTVNLTAYGVYSGGPYGSNLAFRTTSTTSVNERMRIDSSGQTMLGTTTPVATGAGSLTVGATTASTSTTSGALTVAGGVGIAGNLNTGTSDASAPVVYNSSDVSHNMLGKIFVYTSGSYTAQTLATFTPDVNYSTIMIKVLIRGSQAGYNNAWEDVGYASYCRSGGSYVSSTATVTNVVNISGTHTLGTLSWLNVSGSNPVLQYKQGSNVYSLETLDVYTSGLYGFGCAFSTAGVSQ